MTRTLAASVNSAIAQPVATFYTLADVILDSGTIRAFNGAGYLKVGANTYSGVGDLGGIDAIREDADEFPRGLKLTLAAVTSSNLLSEALQENLFNREVKLYRCWYDTTSLSAVNTAECWFKGKINEVNMYRGDQEKGDYLELTLATRLRREANASYYTQEDLWLTYSGDTFFQHVDKIPGFKSLWGQKPTYFDTGASQTRTDPGFKYPRDPTP
jgi:hypothetical protein